MDISVIITIASAAVFLAGIVWRGSDMYSSLKSEVKEIKDDVHDMRNRMDKADEIRGVREGEISKIREELKGIATLLKTNLNQLQEQMQEHRKDISEQRRNWAELFKEYDLKKKKDE